MTGQKSDLAEPAGKTACDGKVRGMASKDEIYLGVVTDGKGCTEGTRKNIIFADGQHKNS